MKIQYHWQLDVYKLSVEAGMDIFHLSKKFPKEETYSLTDQIRRSSRSVSGQIAEGWRRRKYKDAFINKFNEAEGEAAETQTWIEYAVKCEYISRKEAEDLHKKYDHIISMLVNIQNEPDKWTLKKSIPVLSLSHFLTFSLSLLFASCTLINPAEPVPGYLAVDSIKLKTTSEQGSSSSHFTDVWVTVDGMEQGVYEMPAKFPLLFSGTHRVQLKAGIMLNGIADTRVAYSVVNAFDTTMNFVSDKSITINPVLTYASDTRFAQIEDFEGSLTFEKTSYSDTGFTIISDTNAFEGKSGAIFLDSKHVKFECASIDTFALPSGVKPCYAEINYKGNVEFAVGTIASLSVGPFTNDPIAVVRASTVWKKIYINLTADVTNTYGATGWKIYLYAGKDTSQATAALYLDNIKVVY